MILPGRDGHVTRNVTHWLENHDWNESSIPDLNLIDRLWSCQRPPAAEGYTALRMGPDFKSQIPVTTYQDLIESS